MKSTEFIDKIKSKEDFLKYINLLLKDIRNGLITNDQYVYKSEDEVYSYLETMRSWCEDMGDRVGNDVSSNSWAFFAKLLYAGLIYE